MMGNGILHDKEAGYIVISVYVIKSDLVSREQGGRDDYSLKLKAKFVWDERCGNLCPYRKRVGFDLVSHISTFKKC
jgi:hypothetical protein